MIAKEYLGQYQKILAEKQNLISEKENIIINEASPPSIDYSGDRIHVSGHSDGLYSIHARIHKRTRWIDKRLFQIDRKLDDIKAEINHMGDHRYVRLLWLRYVDGRSLDDVAKLMGYEPAYVRRLHGQALQAFERGYTKIH